MILNIDKFTFSIETLESDCYFLTHSYRWFVRVGCQKPWVIDDLLCKPAKLMLHNAVIHGVISKIEGPLTVGQGNHYFQYKVILSSSLWPLSAQTQHRVFLNKSVTDVILDVLSRHGWIKPRVSFYLQREYLKRPLIRQVGETDLNFITRLMEEVGLNYAFEQEVNQARLVITDNVCQLNILEGFKERRLRFDRPDEVCDLMTVTKMITQSVYLRAYNDAVDALYIEGYDKQRCHLDCLAHGYRYYYGEYFRDRVEGQYLAQVRQEALDWQRYQVNVKTHHALSPGQCVQLCGHRNKKYNRAYRVIELHCKDARVSGWVKGYRVVLIPVEVPYRSPLTVSRPRVGLHVTTIEGLQNGYRIRFPFDTEHAVGKASPPVRLVQPGVGENRGFHFPLGVGVRVVCGYIDDHPDRPVLLGALPARDRNYSDTRNILETHAGNALVMDDTLGAEKFSLLTAQQKQLFELSICEKSSGIKLLACRSDLSFESDKQFCVKAEKSIVQHALGNYQLSAKGQLHIKAETGDIHFQSGGDVHLSADDNMSFKANKNALNVKGLSVQLNGAEKSTWRGKSVTIISQHGKINLKAKKGMYLRVGSRGKVCIKQGGCEIILDGKGHVHIKAAKAIRLKGAVSGI